jgi:hypothetical protein
MHVEGFWECESDSWHRCLRTVEHVHVIRATSGQRETIERALTQWKLKPHEINGRTNEIETGLLIRAVFVRLE